MRYLLDTNVFNRLLDYVDLALPTDGVFVATHVQRDEVSATKNDERRNSLQKLFELRVELLMPSESFVWGVSRWGVSKWASGESKYQSTLDRLKALDKQFRKTGKSVELSQVSDILIAETAIANGCTLITGDKNLATVCEEFGGSSLLLPTQQ